MFRSSQPIVRLHAILERKIEYYLTFDNPPKPSSWSPIRQLFPDDSEAGRQYAINYKAKISEKLLENQLLSMVYQDICHHLPVDAVFCKRLVEGICEALKIHADDIEAQVNKQDGLLTYSEPWVFVMSEKDQLVLAMLTLIHARQTATVVEMQCFKNHSY